MQFIPLNSWGIPLLAICCIRLQADYCLCDLDCFVPQESSCLVHEADDCCPLPFGLSTSCYHEWRNNVQIGIQKRFDACGCFCWCTQREKSPEDNVLASSWSPCQPYATTSSACLSSLTLWIWSFHIGRFLMDKSQRFFICVIQELSTLA